MKCFNHRELDAIAVCKHCGKAVCSNCVADVKGVMACKSRCEAEVLAHQEFLSSSNRHLAFQVPLNKWLGYFMIGAAVTLAGFGVWVMATQSGERGFVGFLLGTGCIFGVCGYFLLRHVRALERQSAIHL